MPRVGRHDEFHPLDIGETTKVLVLTGAGISAESGLSTFRDQNGLWERHRFEEVASSEGFAEDPILVWKFYSQRRAQALTVHPNPAHRALTDLERRLGDRLTLCTQNVDDLHERGGSSRVIHMHGELFKSRCENEHEPPFLDQKTYFGAENAPYCSCGARLRPHICWFGEVPFELDRIARALSECDLFITVGSSGAVYPAASFGHKARSRGAKTIYVGIEEPDNIDLFDECRLGKAGEVLPSLF